MEGFLKIVFILFLSYYAVILFFRYALPWLLGRFIKKQQEKKNSEKYFHAAIIRRFSICQEFHSHKKAASPAAFLRSIGSVLKRRTLYGAIAPGFVAHERVPVFVHQAYVVELEDQ